MKKLLSIILTVVSASAVLAGSAFGQTSTSTTEKTKQTSKRGPVFRATKEQINQAQGILKSRGFYSGEQIGKLDDATREGLKKYQQAEGIKVTGTLNKSTLEKMNIVLTDKQRAM
jgi:peptidoglycan hydrolase-like protein with peptidoglycan-binding domain